MQDGKITFHDWTTDRLDNLARSKAVRLAVSDLQTIGFILQENVLTRPLIGDHAPDANPQFVRIMPVILQDTSQRAERQFRLTRQCLEAGLHVLVEKPLATTATEAQALDDLARLSGSNSTDEYFGSIRLDYRISDKLNAYARYNRDQGYLQSPFDVSGA